MMAILRGHDPLSRRYLLGTIGSLGAALSRGTLAPRPTAASHGAVLTIDGDQRFQTMAGFGASARVFDDPHLTETFDPATERAAVVVPEAAQDEILDLLYTDLGLTRLRPNLDGPGIEPDNDNADPDVTDLTRFNFAWKRLDAHIDLARRCVERGVDTSFFSPLQLEAWMTEENPAEYVEWALAVLRRARDRGLPMPYLSVVNEPGYQGSGIWSGEFLRDVIKLLGPRLRAEGFETRFVAPDDLNASRASERCRIILADEDARRYVGALACHLYDEPITRVSQMTELSAEYGLPLWMTEWYQADGFEWAATMQALIADYGVSAVDYLWGFFGQWQDNGSQLIVLTHDAANRYTGHNLRKQYFVVGQFSRYVRPGAVRVRATSTDPAIRLSAFVDGSTPILVALNSGAVEQPVDVTLAGFPDTTAVRPVRTSVTEDWAELDAIPVRGSRFAAVLPPSSLTTFVGAS